MADCGASRSPYDFLPPPLPGPPGGSGASGVSGGSVPGSGSPALGSLAPGSVGSPPGIGDVVSPTSSSTGFIIQPLPLVKWTDLPASKSMVMSVCMPGTRSKPPLIFRPLSPGGEPVGSPSGPAPSSSLLDPWEASGSSASSKPSSASSAAIRDAQVRRSVRTRSVGSLWVLWARGASSARLGFANGRASRTVPLPRRGPAARGDP